MKKLCVLLVCWVHLAMIHVSAEPTENRKWKATSGHHIEAVALKVVGNKVVLKKANGKTITVPMAKLVEADRKFLAEHFELDDKVADEDDADQARARRRALGWQAV